MAELANVLLVEFKDHLGGLVLSALTRSQFIVFNTNESFTVESIIESIENAK
jgi:hypothetical protein